VAKSQILRGSRLRVNVSAGRGGVEGLLITRDGMPTPDGISDEEWSRVKELTIDIFHSAEDQRAEGQRRLFEYLDKLEAKYGPVASILATRADFMSDPRAKDEILRAGFISAEASNDSRNALYIAHSLAELHIEGYRCAIEGWKWLERLKQFLLVVEDSWFGDEYSRLRSALDDLEHGRREP